MQMSFANLETDSDDDNINKDDLQELAKLTYEHLIVYLTSVRQLYDKGIDAKSNMEEILGISSDGLPDIV